MAAVVAVSDDDVLLLNIGVDGVGVEVLVILEVLDDVNTSVVAALVAGNDVLLLEAAADADVEVLVPPAVLVDAASAPSAVSVVLVMRAEVLVGTGVGVATNPLVLDDVNASVEVLVPPAVLVDAAPAPSAASVVLVMRAEVLVGTGVDVATNPVVLDDTNAIVTMLVAPAVLLDVASVVSVVLVTTALAVLDVDGDELLESAMAEVLVGTGVDVATNPVVLDDVNASTLVLTAVDDDLSSDTHTHSHGSNADVEALVF